MLRFIHTADWQIGMKAAHVGTVGQIVRAERLEAANRVVEAATNHRADFIMLAGDTFEDNAVDRVLVQQIADILGTFSGKVYIISGNHDPLVPGSVWDHGAGRPTIDAEPFRTLACGAPATMRAKHAEVPGKDIPANS